MCRYFLVDGNLTVQNKGKTIAVVHPYHFIGEMSFLNYCMDESNNNIKVDHLARKTSAAASANVIVDKGEAQAYVWEFETLRNFLKSERQVSNALSAYMNYDLRQKLLYRLSMD